MKLKNIILMALVCIMLIAPALAVNMTFSEMGFSGPQTIQIFEINETGVAVLVGTYNTTSNGVAVPTTDFSIVIKPESSAYLKNPNNLLDAGFEFVETYYIAILFIMFMIGVAYLGRRR